MAEVIGEQSSVDVRLTQKDVEVLREFIGNTSKDHRVKHCGLSKEDANLVGDLFDFFHSTEVQMGWDI